MTEQIPTNGLTIWVRRETYNALKRLREDQSYPTMDMLIRDALKARYPHLDL